MDAPDSIYTIIDSSYSAERAGNISFAIQQAQVALERARSTGESEVLAESLACLAYMYDRLGHHDKAQDLATEALDQANPLSPGVVRAWKILGDCAHERGDLASSEKYFHLAIDLARQLGLTYMLHRCLHSLSACVYIPRGQFELALAADSESVELAENCGFLEEIWLPLLTLSSTLWLTGNQQRAMEMALHMGEHSPPLSLAQGYYFSLRGDFAQDSYFPQSAMGWYEQARHVAELLGEPGLNVEVRLSLSRFHRTYGSPAAAYEWAEDALAIGQRANSSDLEGLSLIERGLAAWMNADLQQAETDFQAAAVILTDLQASYDLARISFHRAVLYRQNNDPKAEDTWLEAVRRITIGGYSFLLERERSAAFPLLAYYLNSPNPEVAALSNQLMDHLAKVKPPPLKISTLGEFEVQQGNRVISDQAWRQRKAGELFRLLLVSQHHRALREEVIESLWPDNSISAGQDLLHQATSALRKAVEPDLPNKFPSRYLFVEGGYIRLELPPGSTVDFEMFEESIQQKNWELALTQYHGNLFPNDRYADWAVEPCERLQQKAVLAGLAVAQQKLEAGDAQKSLAACRYTLTLEPWQEEAVLLGMKACMMLNDRAAAIRLYKKLERILREELDVAPQPAISDYYRTMVE